MVLLSWKTTEVKLLEHQGCVAWCFSGTQSSLRGQKVAAG